MIICIILAALLIERFFDWSHLRKWTWLLIYQRKLTEHFPTFSAVGLLAILMLPVLLVLMFFTGNPGGFFAGLLYIIFAWLVLMYCLGPRNVWADTYSVVHAFANTKVPNQSLLLSTFGIHEEGLTETNILLKQALVVEANRRVFAVIFWFLLLGPLGAVLYRMTDIIADSDNRASIHARTLLAYLDFLPVRTFALLLALVGHFTQSFPHWRHNVLHGVDRNHAILVDAVSTPLDEQSHLKATIQLIDRAFILTMSILVITLIA